LQMEIIFIKKTYSFASKLLFYKFFCSAYDYIFVFYYTISVTFISYFSSSYNPKVFNILFILNIYVLLRFCVTLLPFDRRR